MLWKGTKFMTVARASASPVSYTFQEFERMPEFNQNYELVEGRLVAKAMPSDRHSRIADELLIALRFFDRQLKLGRAWRELTIKIPGDDGNGRVPDLTYVVASRIPPVSDGALAVVPDLVVEVWSPSDTNGKSALESTRKKMLYWPQHGVKITWCINPAVHEVEVLYGIDQAKSNVVLALGDELTGEEVLPGFKLAVAELFQD
jgi:Uma2 family endonuclease